MFSEWNKGELDSFLVEITSKIFLKKDDLVEDGSYLVDKILDSAGNKVSLYLTERKKKDSKETCRAS